MQRGFTRTDHGYGQRCTRRIQTVVGERIDQDGVAATLSGLQGSIGVTDIDQQTLVRRRGEQRQPRVHQFQFELGTLRHYDREVSRKLPAGGTAAQDADAHGVGGYGIPGRHVTSG